MKSKMKFIFAGIFFLGYVGFTSFISSSVSPKPTKTEIKEIPSKQNIEIVNNLKKSK
jgi:hypothetical protein